MFGIDWPELMVVGLVALIVIGPEDLPQMFRQLGRFTAKLRQMSREFSRAMEQAAKDSGVKDVHADLKGMTSSKSLGLDAVKNAADSFEKWDPLKNAVRPTAAMPARSLVPPPMPATPPLVTTSSLTSAAERDAAVDPVDDLGEAEDDLAAHAEVVPGNTIHGPATQALYDKQALRAQVMAEQTAKLKEIDAGTYRSPVAVPVGASPAQHTAMGKTDVFEATSVVEPVDTLLGQANGLAAATVADVSAMGQANVFEAAAADVVQMTPDIMPRKRAVKAKPVAEADAAKALRKSKKKADMA